MMRRASRATALQSFGDMAVAAHMVAIAIDYYILAGDRGHTHSVRFVYQSVRVRFRVR